MPSRIAGGRSASSSISLEHKSSFRCSVAEGEERDRAILPGAQDDMGRVTPPASYGGAVGE